MSIVKIKPGKVETYLDRTLLVRQRGLDHGEGVEIGEAL